MFGKFFIVNFFIFDNKIFGVFFILSICVIWYDLWIVVIFGKFVLIFVIFKIFIINCVNL